MQYLTPDGNIEAPDFATGGIISEIYDGSYDMREPNNTDIVMDVGAHVGVYTLKMSRKVAYVYAFEPCAFIRSYLEKNIAKNQLTNVTVFPFGLFDRKTSLKITLSKASIFGILKNAGSTTLNEQMQGEKSWVSVERADEIPLMGPVNFLKIDVEGFEMNVLRGFGGKLSSIENIIIAAYHYPEEIDELSNYLCNSYDISILDDKYLHAQKV